MRARIYQPAKNAMQSGKARTKQWLLEYEPEAPRGIDPLMGWTSSSDMRQQVAAGIRYQRGSGGLRRKAWHRLIRSSSRTEPAPSAKSYSDNFRFDRKVPWSH